MKYATLLVLAGYLTISHAQTSLNSTSGPCTNGGGSTITISKYPSKDASVGYHYGYGSEDTNYGDAPHNSPFSQPSAADVTEENMGWALIDFDLTEIPETAEILTAYLDLHAYTTAISPYIAGHIGDNTSWISRITENWGEMTVTWNTKPGYSTTNQVSIGPSVAYDEDFIGINVTDLVTDMLADPANSFGFSIRLDEESPTRGLMFCSSDVASETKWPMLTVNYCDLSTAVSNPSNLDISINQNIETDEIFISVNSINSFALQYQLFDISGKICLEESVLLNPGDNRIRIDLKAESISHGYYILQCNTINQNASKMVVVRN